MMLKFKKALAVPAVAAITLVSFVGSDLAAFAQSADGDATKTHLTRRYHTTVRPLTVRRAATVAAAPVAPAAAVVNPVTGAASTVVGLPFQALGAVFPAGNGPRSGGVTPVRYVNSGPETAKIDEGFAQPVPVALNGPIYVVANGDPTINPLSIVGAPIAVAGQIAQTPFKIIGATGL